MKKILGTVAILIGTLAVLACGPGAVDDDISGAGATFPYPLYAKWASMYKGKTGIGLNYQSIGSGGGIAQIKARTVTFGATDMPLKPDELQEAGLVQFPTVVGGVVPVVNIKGIEPGQLVLDGPTLAKIYLGEIKRWNDPAIEKLNPAANLPNQAIVVVRRSDGSGTTFIFVDYLAKVSPDWKENVGVATSVAWPVGVGAKGNEGVAGNVAQASGSIGYVEYVYAKHNRMSHIRMINRSGQAVGPSIESFQAAAAGVDWAKAPGMYLILTNASGEKAWPIAGATFILMYKKPANATSSKTALDFFKWAYAEGDDAAAKMDYVPLPDSVVGIIRANWKQIEGAGH